MGIKEGRGGRKKKRWEDGTLKEREGREKQKGGNGGKEDSSPREKVIVCERTRVQRACIRPESIDPQTNKTQKQEKKQRICIQTATNTAPPRSPGVNDSFPGAAVQFSRTYPHVYIVRSLNLLRRGKERTKSAVSFIIIKTPLTPFCSIALFT